MTVMNRLAKRFQLLAIYKKLNFLLKTCRDEKLKDRKGYSVETIKDSWSHFVVSDEVDFQTQNNARENEDIIY